MFTRGRSQTLQVERSVMVVAFAMSIVFATLCCLLPANNCQVEAQTIKPARSTYPPGRRGDSAFLKHAFHEDYRAVVRIRTTYNSTSFVTCNGVVMEMPNLVLSDVSCIKYHGMANIDAKYVTVIAGDPGNEEKYEVEQIFINKANPNDPSTELALLKLRRGVPKDMPCLELRSPELNSSSLVDSSVRVVGFTPNFELKENRTKIARRIPDGADKYVCTLPANVNETPGTHLMKGAPLMAPVECRTYLMIGILTRVDIFFDGTTKKQQDCYVQVMSQLKWYTQVKSLAMVSGKNDAGATEPSVVMVTVD